MKHYIVLYVEENCFIYFVHLLTRLLAKAHGWEAAQWLAPSANSKSWVSIRRTAEAFAWSPGARVGFLWVL